MVATVLVLREEQPETRVAAVPATVKRLVQEGFQVLVGTGAGTAAGASDADYSAAGARIISAEAPEQETADFLLLVNVPTAAQLSRLKAGASVISFLYPSTNPQLAAVIAARRLKCFAMEAIPRITRAQKYDALSSQANLGGYQATLLAAVECPKIFPLLMTAAGTLRPARVVILGAGVAGLQAAATAKRLGALVAVSDIRPAVKEQVQSLGAVFIEVPTDENMEATGGYAKEASPEFLRRQAEVTKQHLVRADAVITSALVPGKRAPLLIPAAVVAAMKAGCVIVDMAAAQGGNCALTQAGQTVIHNGVKIIGALNLPGQVPVHASEAYAQNVMGVLLDLTDKQDRSWRLDDEIVAAALVADCGELTAR